MDRRMTFGGSLSLVFLFLFFGIRTSSFEQTLDAAALAKKVQPCVMLILEKDSSGKAVAAGSGLVVSADGKVVTNDHGNKQAQDLLAQATDGRVFRVLAILARDSRHDRELLQLAARGLRFLPIFSPASVREGDALAILPSPLGGSAVLATASIERRLFSQGERLIAVTSALPRFYAGAPVIGSQGQVLGVATARASRGKSGNLLLPVAAIGKLAFRPDEGRAERVGGSKRGEMPPEPDASAGASVRASSGSPGQGEELEDRISPPLGRTGAEEEAAWRFLLHREYAKAAAAFERLLRRRSSDAGIWLGFGLAKRELGQMQEACTIFGQAVRLDPSSGRAWRELAEADWELKRYSEASEAFGRAAAIRPGDARAWLGVAAADLVLGKQPEARAAVDRVRDLAPKKAALWREAGKIYRRLGRSEDAAAAYQRAVDLDPNDSRAWLELGLVSVELGRMERAEEILPKLLALNEEMGMRLVEVLRSR